MEIDISNYFLSKTPTAWKIRTRIDKWDCIKLKTFCTSKETITGTKSQPTEWEKILPGYSRDKGLISLKKLEKPKLQKNE
jgi:hypothetical protein